MERKKNHSPRPHTNLWVMAAASWFALVPWRYSPDRRIASEREKKKEVAPN